MNLSLVSEGALLHVKDEMFEVVLDQQKSRISPKKISRIVIANHVRLTTDVMNLALNYNIDILILDRLGNVSGRVWHPTMGSTSRIRIAQTQLSQQPFALQCVLSWVAEKMQNQAHYLKQLAAKRPAHKDAADQDIAQMNLWAEQVNQLDPQDPDTPGRIRGLEGACGRHYFSWLSKWIPENFAFVGRSFRPARDPFNAMLNYSYAVLYGRVEKAVHLAGLDPHLGFLHRNDYNQKSFVYDVIEPFRIHMDRAVFTLFTRKKLNKAHFSSQAGQVVLQKETKGLLLEAIEAALQEKTRYNQRQVSREHALQLRLHAFAQTLLEEALCSSGSCTTSPLPNA